MPFFAFHIKKNAIFAFLTNNSKFLNHEIHTVFFTY